MNIIRSILFLGIGAGLLFVPYERFKSWFPKAPGAVAVKILGAVILLCGLVILAISMIS